MLIQEGKIIVSYHCYLHQLLPRLDKWIENEDKITTHKSVTTLIGRLICVEFIFRFFIGGDGSVCSQGRRHAQKGSGELRLLMVHFQKKHKSMDSNTSGACRGI